MYILPKKKYKRVKELIIVASFDSCQAMVDAAIALVSFAAVIRVVTRHATLVLRDE